MAIAGTITRFLDTHNLDYEVMHHPHSTYSSQSAQLAHVPGGQLAKGVLLTDGNGYVLAVLPTTHRLWLGELRRELGRELRLASEADLGALFPDCEIGAVPALGQAYGIETWFEDDLLEQPDIYLEAGDHVDLIHLGDEAVASLLDGAQHRHFSAKH